MIDLNLGDTASFFFSLWMRLVGHRSPALWSTVRPLVDRFADIAEFYKIIKPRKRESPFDVVDFQYVGGIDIIPPFSTQSASSWGFRILMTFLFSPVLKRCCAPGDSYPPYTTVNEWVFTYFYSPQGSGVRVENVSNCHLDSYSYQWKIHPNSGSFSQRCNFVSGAANSQSPALVVKAVWRYYGRAFLNSLRRSTNYLSRSSFSLPASQYMYAMTRVGKCGWRWKGSLIIFYCS